MHTLTEAYAMSNTELREALDAARVALAGAAAALGELETRCSVRTDLPGQAWAHRARVSAERAAIRAQDVLNG